MKIYIFIFEIKRSLLAHLQFFVRFGIQSLKRTKKKAEEAMRNYHKHILLSYTFSEEERYVRKDPDIEAITTWIWLHCFSRY